MVRSKRKRLTRDVSPEEAKRRHDLMDAAVRNFSGSADELESALGMYILGRHTGWKPLMIMHSKRTIRKYEEILGVDIRSEFPEEGPDAEQSLGYRIARSVSNFWKVVSGEDKSLDRASRKALE